MISHQLGRDNAYMEEGNQNPYSKEKDLDLWYDYENGYRDGLKELEIDMKNISIKNNYVLRHE